MRPKRSNQKEEQLWIVVTKLLEQVRLLVETFQLKKEELVSQLQKPILPRIWRLEQEGKLLEAVQEMQEKSDRWHRSDYLSISTKKAGVRAWHHRTPALKRLTDLALKLYQLKPLKSLDSSLLYGWTLPNQAS